MKLILNLYQKSLLKIWFNAAEQNNNLLTNSIDPVASAKILDVGCYTGEFLVKRVKNIAKPRMYGIDINQRFVSLSKKSGIKAIKGDVEKDLPFKSNFFDIVVANQIIEHLVNVDNFVREIHRVLKPNGYLIISTENLSSWHNIFALLFGWQAFSQHLSAIKSIGNPIRIFRYKKLAKSEMHNRILTPKGLTELLELHGFRTEKFFGAGYYPFPPPLSRILSNLDPTHAAFIGVKARKIPKKSKD